MLAPLLENPLAAKDAIAALRRYSLVSAPADGLVSVHRLVQAVTLDQMPRELAAEWQQAAAVVVEAAIPDDPEQPESWRTSRSCCHTPRRPSPPTPGHGAHRSLPRVQWQLRGRPRPEPGARGARESVLGGKPESLAARASLAFWTGKAGNAAGARDQFAALLPLVDGGPEHPDTLATRAHLARWTGAAGNWAAARDQFAALLPVAERVLGPEHPDTLRTRGNLAYWTGQAGDPAAARDLFTSLLPVAEHVLGLRHPDTLLGRALPRPLDRRGGRCHCSPRPIRRASACSRAGFRPGAPRHPVCPRKPRLLDRIGG